MIVCSSTISSILVASASKSKAESLFHIFAHFESKTYTWECNFKFTPARWRGYSSKEAKPKSKKKSKGKILGIGTVLLEQNGTKRTITPFLFCCPLQNKKNVC